MDPSKLPAHIRVKLSELEAELQEGNILKHETLTQQFTWEINLSLVNNARQPSWPNDNNTGIVHVVVSSMS